jgi:hypothetical protein
MSRRLSRLTASAVGVFTFYAIFNSGEAWVLACENRSALSTMLPINSW